MNKLNLDLELLQDKIIRYFWWIHLAALGAILAASGACGLVYELVWTRLLSLILGSTSLGVAAALAGFMGGLAGGSLLAGRFLDRKPHLALKLYAFLELGIGFYALISPWLLTGIQALYVRFYGPLTDYHSLLVLLRFCLALVMMGIPAALMGGTLPAVLTHVLPKLKRVGFKVGFFYGLNTLGGMLGAFGAGFFLLPGLGIKATLFLTASLNIMLALLVFYGLRRDWFGIQEWEEEEREEEELIPRDEKFEPAGSAGGDRLLVYIGAGVIGFCGLAYEVIWMRILNLTFGSSVYAFSTMLTAFLAGIGLGSLSMASRLNREEEPWYLFGWYEMGIAFFGVLLIPIFGRLPLIFPVLYNTFYHNFNSFQYLIFGIFFLLMIGPTFLMGASLPLLLRAGIYSTGRTGGGVGSVYAINALGAIGGSLAATFLMIPLLGTRVSLITVSSLNLAVGAWALWRSTAVEGVGKRLWPMAVPLAVLILVSGYSRWNPSYLTTGFYTTNLVNLFHEKKVKITDLLKTADLLYYREGISSTVTVKEIRSSGIRSIQINGKTDASTGRDVRTQYLVGYLPYLWQENIRDVLVIGLGSGMTVAAALEFQPCRVTCVEIETAVREAAKYFKDYNYDCLNNPRLNLIIGDGRNHLLAVPDQYDAIISQPSNPWVTGESNLFTLENYQSAYRRLKPGGLMVQWFHFYTMSTRDFKIALHTFREVFPQAHLWWLPQSGDVIMLAAKNRPLRYDFQILRHRLAQHPRLKKDL
ncbi:fused MFS/spermidine synthase, partial [bacterium]|nr:fused MFS/spermidine synthase [bacterium]